jgi:tubulin monoglycylase TTLL3/8
MFLNVRLYYEAMGRDVFNAVPVTFHIKEGLEDPEFSRFKSYYFKEEEEVKKQKAVLKGPTTDNQNNQSEGSVRRNIWIVKPGENTNRGNGITVSKEFDEIKNIIVESTANKKRTCIVQKYIHNPLLINRRKFDIRLYAFLSCINGNMKGYFYNDGYLRTSCREFSL